MHIVSLVFHRPRDNRNARMVLASRLIHLFSGQVSLYFRISAEHRFA